MRILLDTCVLTEVRNQKGLPAVKAAVAAVDDKDLYVSVVTVGEIAKGIELLPPSAKKRDLTEWLSELRGQFSHRILPIDVDTSEIWGEITARAQLQGTPLPVSDGLIAATAIQHGLHVMTRNVRHFSVSGALTIDPWNQN